jgi:hypothetical protein
MDTKTEAPIEVVSEKTAEVDPATTKTEVETENAAAAATGQPNKPGASNLEELHKSTCGSVNTRLPEIEPDIVYPLDYANDPFLKNLWETTLTNLKNASKPLEILEAIASTAMLEGYIAKFATSILEGVVTDDDMRDMLVNGIKTFTTTKLAGLSLEQYGKVSKVIENSASSPDLAMLMIQQLGKAMVKPDAKAIRNKLKKLNTNCEQEAAEDAAALEIQKARMAKAAEDKKKEEDAKAASLKEREAARVLRSTDLKEKYKEGEKKKAEKKLADEKKANESSFFSMFRSKPEEKTATENEPKEGVDTKDDKATVVDAVVKEATVEGVNESGANVVPSDTGVKEATPEGVNADETKGVNADETKGVNETGTNEPKVETPTEPASIQEDNKEEKKEKEGQVEQVQQTIGGKTRRKRVSARKTRKHWLLFTLRDIL